MNDSGDDSADRKAGPTERDAGQSERGLGQSPTGERSEDEFDPDTGTDRPGDEFEPDTGPGDPVDPTYPPLDVVDSRWWYWIVAYPVVTLLFVPFVVISSVVILSPFLAVGPEGPGGGAVVLALVGWMLLLLTVFLVVAVFVVVMMLPVALYFDARAVGLSHVDWEPDPILYAIGGLSQFVVTPLVAVAVALYYLYQRHEHVGIP